MKEKENLQLNEEGGITLIALVITIIVLLILAGVGISMLTGDNGIIEQAYNAKKITEEKTIEEAVKLAAIEALMDGNDLTSIENVDDLNNALRSQGLETTTTGDVKKGYIVNAGEKYYSVATDGIVKEISKDDISVPVTSITIAGPTEVGIGETIQLTAEVLPENVTNKTVTWSSSDNSLATVDSTGKVTGLVAGSVTITATAGGVDVNYTVIIEGGIITNKLNGAMITIDPNNSSYIYNYNITEKTLESSYLSILENEDNSFKDRGHPIGIGVGNGGCCKISKNSLTLNYPDSPPMGDLIYKSALIQVNFVFLDGTTDYDTFLLKLGQYGGF